MAHIRTLIQSTLLLFTRGTKEQTTFFIAALPLEDQCALVTAVRTGEDHLHHDRFMVAGRNSLDYFTQEAPCNRYFHTGNGDPWFISPDKFPELLWKKRTRLAAYFAAFERCAKNSGISLDDF